ncbi:AAA family ATPase [Candidatus Saccharibacteria bacterium]|nr:AAA family ATPase [Candidatus Saccharibacteria bacterium]
MNLVINKSSEKIISAMVKDMPQSALLTGPNGVGLTSISEYIAQLLGVKPVMILPEKDDKVDLDKGVISVDIMRRLYDDTKTIKTEKQVIVIDYAERMTHQAQNAFLKLLEEPGENTYFILLSHSTAKLLPTILSRVETVNIKPVTPAQTHKLLDQLGQDDDKKRSQILFMSDGLPAEVCRLVSDEEYFDKRSANVRDARDLLQGSLYQKLLIAQKYKDDRQQTLQMLTDVINILKKTIKSNPEGSAMAHIDDVLRAYSRIEANGNIRLTLAAMAVSH